jgi:hypothetical protein
VKRPTFGQKGRVTVIRSAAIVYEGLPVSAGGAHRIRERDPRIVWTKLAGFLADCAEQDTSPSLSLAIYDDGTSPVLVDELIADAADLHGDAVRRNFVSGVRSADVVSWSITPSQVDGALAWLTRQPTLASVLLGPIAGLNIEAVFRLKDPRTGEVLPFQDRALYGNQPFGRAGLGRSAFYSRLSDHSTCSIDLCLPFEQVSEDVREYVAAVASRLPFALSSRHWTRLHLNAAGTRYVGRRVTVL